MTLTLGSDGMQKISILLVSLTSLGAVTSKVTACGGGEGRGKNYQKAESVFSEIHTDRSYPEHHIEPVQSVGMH